MEHMPVQGSSTPTEMALLLPCHPSALAGDYTLSSQDQLRFDVCGNLHVDDLETDLDAMGAGLVAAPWTLR
jgi:hypothetical protein